MILSLDWSSRVRQRVAPQTIASPVCGSRRLAAVPNEYIDIITNVAVNPHPGVCCQRGQVDSGVVWSTVRRGDLYGLAFWRRSAF